MNSVHDLGGLEGLGPVNPTTEEPAFHSDWERAVFGMALPTLLAAGIGLDEFRHYRDETMHPVEYLSCRYYERWLHAFETALTEKGVISEAELEERIHHVRADPDAPLPQGENKEQVELLRQIFQGGLSYQRPTENVPRFQPGDAVRVRNHHPSGHTRLALYTRGKHGVIDRTYDAFVFPDSNARGEGENPQYVYTVRFDAAELWGSETSESNEAIYFDFYEPYLESA